MPGQAPTFADERGHSSPTSHSNGFVLRLAAYGLTDEQARSGPER